MRVSSCLLLLTMTGVAAFSGIQRPAVVRQTASSAIFSEPPSSGPGAGGSIEQIEFRIFPDGRVEETVRGVKGGDCEKITEGINKNLGKVVSSEPTAEMYEQDVTIDQTLSNTESSESGWEGSSQW